MKKKLSMDTARRKSVIRNLCTDLFIYGKIKTLVSRAKVVRAFSERILNIARKGVIAQQDFVYSLINNKEETNVNKENDCPIKLNARRKIISFLYKKTYIPSKLRSFKDVINRIFLIAEKSIEENKIGGYIYVLRYQYRQGDAAEQAIIFINIQGSEYIKSEKKQFIK